MMGVGCGGLLLAFRGKERVDIGESPSVTKPPNLGARGNQQAPTPSNRRRPRLRCSFRRADGRGQGQPWHPQPRLPEQTCGVSLRNAGSRPTPWKARATEWRPPAPATAVESGDAGARPPMSNLAERDHATRANEGRQKCRRVEIGSGRCIKDPARADDPASTLIHGNIVESSPVRISRWTGPRSAAPGAGQTRRPINLPGVDAEGTVPAGPRPAARRRTIQKSPGPQPTSQHPHSPGPQGPARRKRVPRCGSL